jgi:hypothetical protein
MNWWVAALVSMLGAATAEAAEVNLLRRRAGRLPWNSSRRSTLEGAVYAPFKVYVIGVTARLMVAGAIGGVYTAGGQITGPLGALTLGVGASLFVTRLAEAKDLGDIPHGAEQARGSAGAGALARIVHGLVGDTGSGHAKVPVL